MCYTKDRLITLHVQCVFPHKTVCVMVCVCVVQVLVVGVGDGGVLRNVSKHSCVDETHLCEIDQEGGVSL